ncbi:MAG TPA: hypothetical protein VFL14_16680 [Xanthomonadales bacterium]|nr:hypothetical protein [Xanthomonadales bacterium]
MAAVHTNQTLPFPRVAGPPGAVRVTSGEQWFPEFIYEVLAHRAGDLHSVMLITTGPLQPRAHIEQFPSRDVDRCATDIRDWLLERAVETSGMDDRILDWAWRVSERVVAPLREG